MRNRREQLIHQAGFPLTALDTATRAYVVELLRIIEELEMRISDLDQRTGGMGTFGASA